MPTKFKPSFLLDEASGLSDFEALSFESLVDFVNASTVANRGIVANGATATNDAAASNVGGVLLDAHCHLEKIPDKTVFFSQPAVRPERYFAMTCTPHQYIQYCEEFKNYSQVLFGLGAHPWWVNEKTSAEFREVFMQYCENTKLIGEIGLDFSPKHAAQAKVQQELFRAIVQSCASKGEKILSIHAVRSAGAVLDSLEKSGVCENNLVIFHWFSGTQQELKRACNLGCYFSVSLKMLHGKKGQNIIKFLSPERILLETDAYPEDNKQVLNMKKELVECEQALREFCSM